ncbi:hypothetical protein CEW92_15375 [Bacillaceae bacterium SAS-127]|nr:hypothetical protein CEW92_15375 [Bacillaceae bacterium SAS-127]
MDVSSGWVSVFYFIFGIAAVIGGGAGGWAADKWGAKRTILTAILLFAVIIFMIPKVTFSIPLFLVFMVLWSMLSWGISPAQQSYIIEAAPETADIQQSLNNSAAHFGIALGSTVGGIVISHYSVEQNATVGGVFVLLAFATALFSITRTRS